MDKIEKFLRSLSPKELEAVLFLQEQIKCDHRKVPGVKALSGMKGWFRVRMGNMRLIFVVDADQHAEIKRITWRNEKTYKDL